MDYFTLFGLPPLFDIDDAHLTTRFQELQRQFHPDRFATYPENERLYAVQRAASINQGYQVLRQPLSRAVCLLSLHGFDINHEQHTLRDTAFLAQQLALREQLEVIEQQQDEKQLGQFMQYVDDLATQRYNQLRTELAQQCWPEAADTVRKLHFLAKLCSQAEDLEERLLDF